MPFRRDTLKRIPWLQLFIESVFVVLSVLLALAVDSWRQNEIHEDLAQQALRNLEREILENKAEVEAIYPYHTRLLDTLKSDHPPTSANLGAAFVQNNAWDAAQAMGAVPYMDFAVASLAARIHETQRQYQSTWASASEIMIRGTFGAGGDDFLVERIPDGLRVLVGQLLVLEDRLLKQYDEALKLLEV